MNLGKAGRMLRLGFRRAPKCLNVTQWRSFVIKVQNVPGLGDSITEGVVVEWSKAVGDFAAVDDVVAIIETDKVSVEIRAEDAGVVKEHFCEIEDPVEVGAKLFSVDTDAAPPAGSAAPPPKTEAAPEPKASEPKAAPAAAAPATPPPAEKKA